MAGDDKDRQSRQLTSVLDELELEGELIELDEVEFQEAVPTVRDSKLFCRYCGLELPHRNEGGFWSAIKHDAPCGLPCLGGGVSATIRAFHSDACPICHFPR